MKSGKGKKFKFEGSWYRAVQEVRRGSCEGCFNKLDMLNGSPCNRIREISGVSGCNIGSQIFIACKAPKVTWKCKVCPNKCKVAQKTDCKPTACLYKDAVITPIWNGLCVK